MTRLPHHALQDTDILRDRFGRTVHYLRLSVTDRCDFRCVYCMAEDMTFLPRAEVLSLEELVQVARAFKALGTDKIRLTGGEPLVRRGILDVVREIGRLGLRDFAMTTNGAQLARHAEDLRKAGLHRLNISLDSLDPERFRELSRTGELARVIEGIDAAKEAGFESIKLNAVILKGRNDDEILDLVDFARTRRLDLSFIEEMPLGEISEHDRAESFCSSDEIREQIHQRFPLITATDDTGGPSRYWRMADSQSRIGFISPHSHNFCSSCNRVRVSVEGRLLLCLGNEHSVDLKAVLRDYPGDSERLRDTIIQAMDLKPEKHHFSLTDDVQVLRFMNMTGG